MIPYGMIKGGSGKIHAHNKCYICCFSENNINPKRVRQRNKKEIALMLSEIGIRKDNEKFIPLSELFPPSSDEMVGIKVYD